MWSHPAGAEMRAQANRRSGHQAYLMRLYETPETPM